MIVFLYIWCLIGKLVERKETVTKTTRTKKKAPKIHRPDTLDKTVQVRENEDLNLKLSYEGADDAKVHWLKDGKPIAETKSVETQTTPDTAAISVKRVTKKDQGTYALVVENEYGTDKVNIDVEVIGKWHKLFEAIKSSGLTRCLVYTLCQSYVSLMLLIQLYCVH